MKITLPVALTTLFVGLKLSHAITWSWLWVLAPLWITATIGFVIGIALLCGVVVAGLLQL